MSNNELKEAELRFKKYSEKLNYFPFCVDVEFWSKNDKNTQNNKLLFIGNDSNRDYELVKNISKHLKDYKTVLITSQINNLEHFDNVKLIKSSLAHQINILTLSLKFLSRCFFGVSTT